jgi:hypothetical protein
MKSKKSTKQNIVKVKIVTHYAKDDPECSSDYYDVEVFVDNKVAITYGDYYHDKGDEAADAFVEGLKFVLGKKNVKVSFSQVADRD